MDRASVVSSNVSSVGFDEASGVLEVEFSGGAIWQYLGVPPSIYKNLMDAESKGKYVNSHIRGKYGSRKVN